jgi:hypothetical protein
MPAPLTGLLPETLWYPEKKMDAIKFLADQPAPANVRRDWLNLWALWVGPRPSASDYRKVQAGAVEV